MPVPTVPDWLGVLLFGIRFVQNNGAAVDDTRTLNFTTGLTATYNTGTGCIDVAAGSGTAIATVAGTAPIHVATVGTTATVSITAASPGVTGSMSGADKTKLDAATTNPTASTIALRDVNGGMSCVYYQTAQAVNVASTGSLRCIVGAQDIVCIKGATHASIPILSVDQGGVEVSIGAGVEISAISFNNAVLNKANVLSFGSANSFTIQQTQIAGTGANAGNDATIQAQQGQNVSSGPNNDGGSLNLLAGIPGTGGFGGVDGNLFLQGFLIELGSPTQADSYVDLAPISAPSSPATNTSRLYSDSGNSGHLSSKSSAGTVTDLIAAAALATAAVPATRNVNTTSPLAGGGALSADLTLTIQASSVSQAGSMSATQATQLAAATTAVAAGTRVFYWAANASTTAASAQNVPPGSQTVTLSDTVLGIQTGPGGGTLTALYLQLTGNAANIAGQTVTFTLIKVTTAGASTTMATSGTMATTAGVKRLTVSSFSAASYSAGDVLTLIMTPSALLTAVLTDVMGGAG